jgi:hypothetical protein
MAPFNLVEAHCAALARASARMRMALSVMVPGSNSWSIRPSCEKIAQCL